MITEGSLLVVLIVNTPKYVKFLTFSPSVFAFRKTPWRYSMQSSRCKLACMNISAAYALGFSGSGLALFIIPAMMTLEAHQFSISILLWVRFSLWHDQFELGCAHLFGVPWWMSGICFSIMRCWKETAGSFIASAFLMQQGVSKFNRHVKWKVFLQFGKKGRNKREIEDFLSSIRSKISHTCMVYWDTFLLNFHSRGQQVEDHVSQWENLLWDTPSKGFERVWLCVQVPASVSCTSLPGWKPSWSLQ